MKAISLWQPWADAIRLGLKRNETRSFPISYRGELLICSSKRPLDDVGLDVIRSIGMTLSGMKFGFGLCVVEIYDVAKTESLTCLESVESQLGNYSPGRYAWLTRNLLELESPIPIVGRQGLWNLPPETEALVREQLK